MKKVRLIHYPKCTTCKKAKDWLVDRKLEIEERDIKHQQPTKEELMLWHKVSKLPLKRFFNTSGLLYKEMKLKERLPGLTEEEQYDLLATDGMLVKRPIVVGEDFVVVGFKEEEWLEVGL